ncbi:hypothetical protein PV379_11110 [Streptomyces caniscabiei]|uniref:hypothetical protein n=1 Tax=Streptomyces caniscabiei TaxID=2746961 RepID=UPI0029B6ECB4|nr:hypothetical protein [Streptomyces caniscabiei]MDX2601660.1 hypothetical protein [Streptomyces caniscabiei]MDX2737095.1 hypothetical protein [Streptomyces caniscabiei]MDX2777858.1 hypothetical protein [Streptomyces caniscabiei]
MNIGFSSMSRIEVMELRLRIERVALEAYRIVCHDSSIAYTNRVPERLAFVLGMVSEDRMGEAIGLIRLGRHVYSKSSDVLHGRSSMLNVPDAVSREWRLVVERLEEIVYV